MQVPCKFFWKAGRGLQEIIPLGFQLCLLTAGKDELTRLLTPLRTLGWSSSCPLKLLRVQSFEKFSYSFLGNTDISHERDRPVQKWDLALFIFIEHIREPLPFQDPTWQHHLRSFLYRGCLFLTIDIPIEVSGVCLYITNQVIHVQFMLFPNISLGFTSQGFTSVLQKQPLYKPMQNF